MADGVENASKRIETSQMSGCCRTLDKLPIASCLLSNNVEKVVLYANTAFYHLIGCAPGEFQYRFGGRFSAVISGEWPRLRFGKDGEMTSLECQVKAEGLRGLWLRIRIRYSLIDGECLLFCVLSDITPEKQALLSFSDYREISERASRFTGCETFEYDIVTQMAVPFHKGAILGQVLAEDQERCKTFQAALLEKGRVHTADAAAFENAFYAIRRKEPSACEVRMYTATGKMLWIRMSLELKEHGPGDCRKAVGVLQDVTESKEVTLQYLGETQYLQSLLAERDAYIQLDVSMDQLLRVGGLWFQYSGMIHSVSYSGLLENYLSKTIHPDDLEYYLEFLRPENLLSSFEDGINRLNCRVRRMVEQDVMVWTEINIYLFRNPSTQRLEALMCTQRQDKNCTWGMKTEKALPDISSNMLPVADPREQDTEFEHFLSVNGDVAYLVDMDNFQFLASNERLYRRVGLTKEECAGQPCYWVMHRRKSPCPFCGRANWSRDKFYIWKNWNETLQQNFLIKNKIVQWHGREVLLAIAVDVSSDKSFLDSLEDGGSESHNVLCGIQRMADAKDRNSAVQSALETIGSYFGARAVQYWEYLPTQEHFFSSNEWKQDPDFLKDSGGQRVFHAVNQWIHKYRWTYPVVIENQEAMLCHSFEMYELLKEAGIHNQRWVPLRDGETLLGILVIMNLSVHFQNNSFLDTFTSFMVEEWRGRATMERMAYATVHDEMTGFSNRVGYDRYLQRFSPDNVESLGVVSATVNDIKGISLRQGLQAADDCVQHFATKFQAAFREGELFRLNEDTFLAVLPNFSMEKLVARTEELGDEVVSCRKYSAHLGYTWDNVENELTVLVQQATQSMKLNKKQQEDSSQISSDQERQTMVEKLVASLENREFEVFLQPKMNLFTGRLMGAEALVRYRDKNGGIVPPSHFIDVLEKQNLIRFIDFFVFEECCRMLEKWKKEGRPLPVISFNFSRLTMLERDITASVQAIYEKYNIPKDKVEVEITESVADLGKGALYQAAHALYQAGFGISLDDFGTKYTNLDILSELDFDMLKVDKSLVNSLAKRRNNQIILQNIITMCKHLNIEVIAEGIETKSQEEVLRSLGCRYGQGYLYGRPVPIPDFEQRFLPPAVGG